MLRLVHEVWPKAVVAWGLGGGGPILLLLWLRPRIHAGYQGTLPAFDDQGGVVGPAHLHWHV